MRASLLVLAMLVAAVTAPVGAWAAEPSPALSHTRLLRRVLLTLEGRPPTITEYQVMLDAADDAARDALIDAQIEASLGSTAFYDQMVEFGYDYLAVRVKRTQKEQGSSLIATVGRPPAAVFANTKGDKVLVFQLH